MGSLTHPKIPIIDLRPQDLKQGTASWVSTSKDVCEALSENGFFVARFDKVDPQLESAIFGAAKELFDLPKETKMKNISDKPSHGYTSDIPIIPIYEGQGIDYVTEPEKIRNFTQLMWPRGNDRFRDVTYSYAKLLEELNVMVVKMIFDHYGLENYESHMESTSYLLRFLKYRSPRAGESDKGLPGHRDLSFLSIVHTSDIEGLEIETKEGEWIGYDPNPNSFVVLTGEVGMAWSNGRMPSCHHRVTMKAKKDRFSFVMFTFVNQTVQVPEKFVDEEHPLKFKPFSHVGLLHFFGTEEGHKVRPHVIKAYSGI